nr:cell-to-cell movement protein [White snakeroot virus A]
MSSQVTRADSSRELLDILAGTTHKELVESGLGVITPVRADAKVVSVALFPPRSRHKWLSLSSQHVTSRKTGGLLFVPRLVVVFVPHVPDDVPGEVEMWIHDNILPNNNAVCGRVRFPLNNGQRLVGFYPHYSIPLKDMVGSRPRSFSVVCEQHGTESLQGGSPFSLFLLWEPQISNRAHNYQTLPPTVTAVSRPNIRRMLESRQSQEQYLLQTTTTEFAAPAITGMCTRCGSTLNAAGSCPERH